ncbi:brain acid soluble protein 1-like [Kogia breviceps]|uniref:brain acid soluble protein 1-like n=1 Tax=Kogia breviceps TaxID=27615 RepID=UPI0034D38AE3
MRGGRIQTEKERGAGGAEEGTPTPPSPLREKKKKKRKEKKKSPGDEAENQKSGGCRRSREHAGDGGAEGAAAAHTERLCLRGAEHAAGPADGRAHARPQRGAARGSISQAVRREQRRPRPEDWKTPPPAAPAKPGGGRGGEKPSLLSPRSRPLPGSSSAAACFSLPYPSGCHKPSALPSPRRETEERRNPRARVPQLGRGPRREARASLRAGGGAEVGNSQCDLGTRLQP